MFVPQLNLLNYYFSLAIAVLLPIAAGVVSARVAVDRADEPALTRLKAVLVAALALSAIPLVIVTVGGLFVRNCDYTGGLAHYLMNPVLGALYGAAAGLFLASFGNLRRATWGVVGWWLATVLANLWHFYNNPPIYAYNPFIGFFSGSVYDNVIPITTTWLLYRANTAVQIALLVALAFRRKFVAAPFAIGAVVFALQAGAIGYDMSRAEIIARLGGKHETEHFVIYYDQKSAVANRIERLAADHEFRFMQLSKLLGFEPTSRITSFIYKDGNQKRRMMGAGKTYIAKPWSGEVHLNAIELGAPVLKHELAHVFGADIAHGWFGIPTQYVIMPRMAIVEGFAVALTWTKGRLTPHQWSAAMHELKIAPPLARILDAEGFLGTHAGQAYTLSGSFLRWLLDTQGVERFSKLYRTGDIQAAYDRPAADVIADWNSFLADRALVPLTEDDLRLAKFHFDRPSKFHAVCALEVAGWEREAGKARHEGDAARALELYQKVLGHDPQNPAKHWQVLDALIAANKLDEALTAADALANYKSASKVLQARARARTGDILWMQDALDEAAAVYTELLDEPLDEANHRRLTVVLAAVKWSDVQARDGVRDYLLGRVRGRDKAIAHLKRLAKGAPDVPIVHYLLGRRLFAAHELEAAYQSLGRALDLGLGSVRLQRAAHEQLGIVRVYTNRPQEAARHFEQALHLHTSDGFTARLADWVARCRWMSTQQARGT